MAQSFDQASAVVLEYLYQADDEVLVFHEAPTKPDVGGR